MKKFSKQTAIILSVILGVVLVVGLIFSFIPMQFGNKTWVGLSNSVNISSDIVGGVYGEFEIKTEEPTRADIEQSKTIIREVLGERGYKNVNVYDIAGEKIRVELSYPKGSTTYEDVVSSLQILTSGKFALQSASSVSNDTIVIEGSECVESVELKTNDSIMGLSVNFTDYGKQQYKTLCESVSGKTNSSSKIYLALGENSPQEVDVSNTISQNYYDSLELQATNYEGIFDLMQRIEIGCMKLEFNTNYYSIDTMSASLSAGESSSSPENASFFSSSTYVILISAIVFVVVIILAIFGIKFGYYAILIFVTMLINAVLFIGLICLIPSIEFGFSAYLAMIVCTALIYIYSIDFAFAVKREYESGKSLNAALETAYKNRLITQIISNTLLFLSALSFVLLSFGELSSVGIIFAISTVLSLVTNIFIIPLLIKICLSFGNFGRKLFMLKKHDISEISEIVAEKEEA